MNLLALKAQRAVWRRREIYRQKKADKAKRIHDKAEYTKWNNRFQFAHTKRVELDRKIAALNKPVRPTHISDRGIKFIADFEGFFATPYNDPVGHATIAYGHLIHLGNVTQADRDKWGTLTKAEGLNLLKKDLGSYEASVVGAVKVPVNQNEFDALVSFTYNLGAGALSQSTLLKKLNAKDYNGAADEFLKWDKAGNPPRPLPGLTRRRKAERALFKS